MVSPERFEAINSETTDRRAMFYWQVDRPITNQEFVAIFMSRHENVDEALIAREAERLLPNSCTVTDIAGDDGYRSGSVNINRLLTCSDGQRVVARIHPAGLVNGYFDVEAVAMEAAGPFVPTPTALGLSHRATLGGLDMLLMTEMSGQNMKQFLATHPEKETTLVVEMGRTMAKLHEVKVEGYGFFDNQHAQDTGELRGLQPDFESHVLAALQPNLQVLIEAGYIAQDQADKITHLLQDNPLLKCSDPRLLHNDMADWNVLTDGMRITAVLDWDECFAGDPVADIACWSLFFTPERLAHFLQGYAEVSPLPHDFDAKLHIYRLRYVVSKLSLRHRKLGLQNDDIMKHLIKVGLDALEAESTYFAL